MGNDLFFNMTPKAKINWDCVKLKSFITPKETINRVKLQ